MHGNQNINKMSQKSRIKVRITDSIPKPAFPTMKERRKLCKEESELLKHWPADAILKWDEEHLMCEFCGLFMSNLSNLRRHYNLHNRDNKECLKCPDCHREFFRSDNLIRHIKTCKIKKMLDAPVISVHPSTLEAANAMCHQACQTKDRTTPAWALKQLVPLDLEIEGSKPRRRLTHKRKHNVVIPLESEVELVDPRSVTTNAHTPITDDDAKLIESMLKDNLPSETEATPSVKRQCTVEIPLESEVKLVDPRGITTSALTPVTNQGANLKMIKECQPEKEVMKVTDENQTGEILFSFPEDWAETYVRHNPVTKEDIGWLEDLLEPKPGTSQNTLMIADRPKPTDPWAIDTANLREHMNPAKNNPTILRPVDPWATKKQHSEADLHIPLNRCENNSEVPDYLLKMRPNETIPPWEFKAALKKIMRQNNEDSIMLDDIDDARYS